MVCKKRYFFALVFLIAGVCSALMFALIMEGEPAPFFSPESTSIIIEHGDATLLMDFVPIDSDLGNPDCTSGSGSVSYMYRIGTFEVTAAQWAAVESADPRVGAAYGSGDFPAGRVSWDEAAKFCNWLTSGDAYAGAYQFEETGTLVGIDRQAALYAYGTIYVLPNENEWIKAAYWTGNGYSIYPNGSNLSSSLSTNDFNYSGGVGVSWNTGTGILEQNGTCEMGGNVTEWIEAATDGELDDMAESRVVRGGAYNYSYTSMKISTRGSAAVDTESNNTGFRVAQIMAPHNSPLAPSDATIYEVPYPEEVYLETPGIAICPDGRLVVTFYVSGDPSVYNTLPGVSAGGRCFIYTSDDNGESWVHRANTRVYDAKPIVAGNKIYLIGRYNNIRIAESSDWGTTWSAYYELTSGEEWHGSANNALVKDNLIYLVMSQRVLDVSSNTWPVAEFETTVLCGDTDLDLTDSDSWTYSSSAAITNFGVFVEGVDDGSIDTLCGLPFYPVYYPNRYVLPSTTRTVSPMGISDGNLIEIVDPHHYFYATNTFHILSRANTGLSNIGGLLKVARSAEGNMEISMQKSPSGRDMLFMPLPGGQAPFYVLYDEESGLYWLLSTLATDSMTKAEYLDSDRFNAPFEERSRLHLWFSSNLYDWCSAGPVTAGETDKHSRHKPSMVVSGDDLVFVCRSGNDDAISADRCNQITFHRISDFRSLIY